MLASAKRRQFILGLKEESRNQYWRDTVSPQGTTLDERKFYTGEPIIPDLWLQ